MRLFTPHALLGSALILGLLGFSACDDKSTSPDLEGNQDVQEDLGQEDSSTEDLLDSDDVLPPNEGEAHYYLDGEAKLQSLLDQALALTNGESLQVDERLNRVLVSYKKEAYGNEAPGFVIREAETGASIFVAAQEAEVASGHVIDLQVTELSMVDGIPFVTAHKVLETHTTAYLIDSLPEDASSWGESDWEGRFYDLVHLRGEIVGNGVDGGAGGSFRRFEFNSLGLTASGNGESPVQLRLLTADVNAYSLQDGCKFDFKNGTVWAYRSGNEGPRLMEPMFFDRDQSAATLKNSFKTGLNCPSPNLISARSLGADKVELKFDRKLDGSSISNASFAFSPGLEVLAYTLSEDGKSLSLTTQAQDSLAYTITLDDSIKDSLGQSLDIRSLDFLGNESLSELALVFCFQDAEGASYEAANLLSDFISEESPFSRHTGAGYNMASPNIGRSHPTHPLVCAADEDFDATSSHWPEDEVFQASSEEYYRFSFKAIGPAQLSVRFDSRRSGTGPKQFALWNSVTESSFEGEVSGSWTGLEEDSYSFDIPESQEDAIEIRIYGFSSGAPGGTFRIDNLDLLYKPL